jgi:hypothetical protein
MTAFNGTQYERHATETFSFTYFNIPLTIPKKQSCYILRDTSVIQCRIVVAKVYVVTNPEMYATFIDLTLKEERK